MGPPLVAAETDEWLGRFHVARRHGRVRGNSARPEYLRQGFRYAAASLVDMNDKSQSNVVAIGGADAPLDTMARPMHDLRISVMDRCNFRCPYCMPKEQFHEHYQFLKS